MLNNASKYALGVSVLGIVAMVVALNNTDHAAAVLLLGVAIVAGVVAAGQIRVVGADLEPFVAPDATASSTPIDPADAPRGSIGPLVLGLSAAAAIAGGALGPYWVLGGFIGALVGSGLWAFDTFREPEAIDAATAKNLDNRLLGPIALPVGAFLLTIMIAYSFSRVLLAVSETASWVTAFIVAAIVLAILATIAAKLPSTRVVSALAGVGIVGVLIAGGAGASAGEREFHPEDYAPPTATITAKDIAYDRKVMGLPADSDADIVFTNLDVGTFHNVAIYTADEPGTPIFNGRPSANGTQIYKLHTPEAGTYRYVCDFHPAMTGEFRVTASTSSEKESE